MSDSLLLPEGAVKIVSRIGDGAYGQVYHCLVLLQDNKPSEKVVKRNYVEKHVDFIGSIRELDLVTRIDHPYLLGVDYLSTGFLDREKSTKNTCDYKADSVYMVMPKGAYDCHRMIYSQKASLIVLREAMAHLTLGVAHLHELGFVHGDIKPRNCIWFREGHRRFMKLGDFGLTRPNFKRLPMLTEVMTCNFRPPELVMADQITMPYDGSKADAWSLGCTLYEMVSWSSLVNVPSENKKALQIAISRIPNTREGFDQKLFQSQAKRTLFNEALGPRARRHFVDLLSRLLEKDPEKRISVRAALKHPFFEPFSELIAAQPTVSKCSPVIRIESTRQRKAMVNFCSKILKQSKAKNCQFIFHALRLFDEAYHLWTPEERPCRQIEWDVLRHSCLYIARKYFDEKCLHALEDLPVNKAFCERYRKHLENMELYLLNDIFSFVIYQASIFESIFDRFDEAPLTEENVDFVFEEYGRLEPGEYDQLEFAQKLYQQLPCRKQTLVKKPAPLPLTKKLPLLGQTRRKLILTTRNDSKAQIGDYTQRRKK